MNNAIKLRIHQMLDDIKDETILQQVMEDVAFYANNKDLSNNLTIEDLNELDTAINQADNNETVSWQDFRKEMNEWKSK
jgi:hypothetical protein